MCPGYWHRHRRHLSRTKLAQDLLRERGPLTLRSATHRSAVEPWFTGRVHCLYDLLFRQRAGEPDCDISVVASPSTARTGMVGEGRSSTCPRREAVLPITRP